MKLRVKAILLALGLTVSSFSMAVYAEEETDAAEQVTDAAEEETVAGESADEETEAAQEEADAAEDETSDAAEDETEAETEEMTAEEYYSQLIDNYLVQIDAWTDDQVDSYMESEDEVTALIAYNWNTVKTEVGNYIGVKEITGAESTSDGYGGVITAIAEYDAVGNGGTVTVTLEYEYTYSSTYGQYMMSIAGLTWDVDYTMGVMMQKAALNTLMGVCIVFCMLAFLSLLISKIHIIPEALEARKKDKEEPTPVPKPVAAPAPAAVEEEEVEVNPADDLELVAVITAAIAAYRENESAVDTGDSYVVRSIKKVNKRNWRRA
ncbi:MAG: OadG family protein [Lachnospiraceae bacterium]|nr:OadG family protein [Lachnospiraceae bacterium]